MRKEMMAREIRQKGESVIRVTKYVETRERNTRELEGKKVTQARRKEMRESGNQANTKKRMSDKETKYGEKRV